MSFRLIAATAVAAGLVPLGSLAAEAGCGHARIRLADCHQGGSTPDLYTTRHRTVLVRPGWWEVRTLPAVYGWRHRQVVVQPDAAVLHTEPARWGVLYAQHVVRPGYDVWVRRGGHFRHDFPGFRRHPHGHPAHVHDVHCRVHVPAAVATVERAILVAPEGRAFHHVPARYEWVDEPYLIRPISTSRVFHPPVYATVSERVLVHRGHRHHHRREHVSVPVHRHRHEAWK